METWYRITRNASGGIQPVEVLAHTDHTVSLPPGGGYQKPHREFRTSSYTSYFPSWEEARRALVNRAKEEIQRGEAIIEHARKELEAIEALTEEGGTDGSE